MITYIDLSKSEKLKLPYLRNTEFKEVFEGKGWSFSYVYHFSELRDVFLAIKRIGYSGKKTFSDRCLNELKLPFVHTPWDEDGRRILEQVNALRNFGLLDLDYKIIDSQLFENSKIGDQINDTDKAIFKHIFFSYYRFKEIMSWFLNPTSTDRSEIINTVSEQTMAQDSNAAFTFSTQSRFTDSFIFDLRDNVPIYYISNDIRESNGGILRFWDVFVKWGTELELIEKFNLKNIDYQLSEDYKSLSCVYFKQTIEESFDLLDFLKLNYKSKYINIPKLIFRIAKQYRYSIENIKKMVVSQSKKHSDKLSLQRTSEIFIRDTEINFVPIVDNSYVSHILIQ
jgi:hypothetical protein